MSENEKHNEKMKEAEDVEAKNFRKKNGKKGLIIVHTGTGKERVLLPLAWFLEV